MKMLKSTIRSMKVGNITLIMLTMMVIIAVAIWMALIGGPKVANAQTTQTIDQQSGKTQIAEPAGKSYDPSRGWGFLAAALATGFSALGAGIAVAIVGSAAMGAVAERPEVMGRSIIFVGLAEGIAIYGLIISIMILSKL